MSVMQEFKAFAMRGNVVDMAIGIVIGTAFGKIVASFVADIIMPPLGFITGGVDLSNLYINLSERKYATLQLAQEAGAVTINYGMFINSILDFIIIAFAIFMVIKQMNKLKAPEPEAAPPTKAEDILLLEEIRDLLKK